MGVARSSFNGKTINESSDTDIYTTVSYGIGIRAMLDKQLYLGIDYMDYGSRDYKNINIKYKGFTIGAGYKF
jgi:hypothetical protein